MKKMIIPVLTLTLAGIAMAGEPAATAPVTRDGLTGKDIYEGRCAGACHQSPPLRSLSTGQWRVVLGTMKKRMASRDMAPLTDEETELLLQFLTEGSDK